MKKIWRLQRSELGPASQKDDAGLLSQAWGRGSANKAYKEENSQKRCRRKWSPNWYGGQPGEMLVEVSDRKMVPENQTTTGEAES